MVTNIKERPLEVLRQMSTGNLYRAAYGKGRTLSQFLNEEMPQDDYKDGLDGFDRLMAATGIRLRSVEEQGIYADTYEAFNKDPNFRALIPEWISRVARRVRAPLPRASTRAYGSDDNILGSAARPYFDDPGNVRLNRITPAIPLSEVVAITTPIDSDAYRSLYLVEEDGQRRMVRVGQGAEIPKVRLSIGQNVVNLYKYGRALEVTYEALRRQPIDMVQLHIERMAVMAEVDKVATVIDVMLNGDGNANTAATVYNLSALDADAGGVLTLKAWLAFKMKFKNPYSPTSALVNEAAGLDMLLLSTGSANIPLVSVANASGFGSFRQMNPTLNEAVALGITEDAPTNKILAFDRRWGIQRLYEIGADMQEVDKFITRQTEVLTLSEVEGYATLDQRAMKVLDLAA